MKKIIPEKWLIEISKKHGLAGLFLAVSVVFACVTIFKSSWVILSLSGGSFLLAIFITGLQMGDDRYQKIERRYQQCLSKREKDVNKLGEKFGNALETFSQSKDVISGYRRAGTDGTDTTDSSVS